jgi:hypothetical protein
MGARLLVVFPRRVGFPYSDVASRDALSSPGSAHTNPMLMGGPGDEAADTNR